ncbi:MAG TPA: hypothetical protein VK856_01225 [Anaerolineaceae bacterium]|nr:hypothetical protein [Anaerolineaceae bacterium]
MSNRRFFILMTIGTILLLFLLLPQEEKVDAGQLNASSNQQDLTQIVLSQLKSTFSDTKSPEVQDNIKNKIQALEYKQQIQAEALSQPQKSLEEVCKTIMNDSLSSAKQLEDKNPQGILVLEEDFLGERGYLMNNMWRGEFSGYETELYAGNLFTDPQQGVVVLNIPVLSFLRVFVDPSIDGSLTITNVDGYQVQLSTKNGNVVYFDIPSQQFINDLAKSMSVVDLPPMPTPIPDPCEPYLAP